MLGIAMRLGHRDDLQGAQIEQQPEQNPQPSAKADPEDEQALIDQASLEA